jgi:hypothetical protein
MIIASVVSVFVNDYFIHNGLLDMGAIRPVARLDCMDYI